MIAKEVFGVFKDIFKWKLRKEGLKGRNIIKEVRRAKEVKEGILVEKVILKGVISKEEGEGVKKSMFSDKVFALGR